MLPVGYVLNNTYRVERLLGRGGMASVYLVSHQRLPRQFALKLITSHFASDSDFLQRFRQEAEILATVDHPHIVQVTDWDQTAEGQPYLVMELLVGEDLSVFCARVKALSPGMALPIIGQIGDALQSAHDRGVVHRDLKPANVFLCRNGPLPNFVKVLDFGIAKSTQSASPMNTNQTTVLGTPAYMSPEQARGNGSDVDARADQFSLAAIAYELLNGAPAFCSEGDSISTTLGRVLNEEPPPLPYPELDTVIRRALSKDRSARFDSISEFVEALGSGRESSGSAMGLRTQRLMAESRPAEPAPSMPSMISALRTSDASMLSGKGGELLPVPLSVRQKVGLTLGGLFLLTGVAAETLYLVNKHAPESTSSAVTVPGNPELADLSGKSLNDGTAEPAPVVAADLGLGTTSALTSARESNGAAPGKPASGPSPKDGHPPESDIPSAGGSDSHSRTVKTGHKRTTLPTPPPAHQAGRTSANEYVVRISLVPPTALLAGQFIRKCIVDTLSPIYKQVADKPIKLERTGDLLVISPIDPDYAERLNRCFRKMNRVVNIPESATVFVKKAK